VRPIAQKEWGTRVALDFYLGGAGAGLTGAYVVAADVFDGPTKANLGPLLTGLALIVIGLLLVISELGRPSNFWRALNGYRTSWMARGSIFSIGLVGSSVLLVAALVWGEAALVPVTAVSSLVFSGLVASYPGFLLFSVLDIRLWRSPLLPALMFSYSVMSGLSLLQLEDLILRVKPGLALSSTLLAGTVVVVILSLVFWGNSMHLSQGSREGYRFLTRGRLRIPFMLGVVTIGLASPLLCYVSLIISGSSGTLFALVGTSSFLIGAFFFRYSVIRAAFHEPLSFSSESMKGLNDAS